MATRIVGLDIGTRNIRALVLEASFRSFELVEVFEEAVRDEANRDEPKAAAADGAVGEEDASADSSTRDPAIEHDEEPGEAAESLVLTPGQLGALERLADKGALDAERVYTNFPEALVYFTEIGLPFGDPREVEAVLAPQLDGRLPVDVEELLLDFMNLGQDDGGEFRIYAGGARRSDVGEYLALLQTHGLDPRVFDVSPFHLWTSSRLLIEDRDAPIAYVDFGAENTRVLVFEGNEVQLSRTIHDGAELITRSIAEQFHLSLDDARDAKHKHISLLAEEEHNDTDAVRAAEVARDAFRPIIREIRRTLQTHAHQHGTPVARIYVGGGGAELRGLPRWLQQNMGIEVLPVPFTQPVFASIPELETRGGRFVGALGLALRGTATEPASTFNLRKDEFEFRGSYAYLSERSTSLAWLAGLLLVSLVFYFFGKTTLMKSEFEAVQSALATATQQTFGAPLRDPEAVIARLQRGASTSSVVPENSAYDVMIQIGSAVVATQDAQFQVETASIEIDMQRATARIGGNCESAEAADVLAKELEDAPCLYDVNRTSLSENRGGSGFEFAFQASVRCTDAVASREGP